MLKAPRVEIREYELHRMFLEFFHKAEAERRWNIQRDIPWHRVNHHVNDDLCKIVESFMAVEMYIPDYVSHLVNLCRRSPGRYLFQISWGYEEIKHGLGLREWMLRSGRRTNEELLDFEIELVRNEWKPDVETPLGMAIYAMFQEKATALNYRNLRSAAAQENDEALTTLLTLIARDETAHYDFFRRVVDVMAREDRTAALREVMHVLKGFRMPAHDLIADWPERGELIVKLGLFNDRMFLEHIVRPILKSLGTSMAELRRLSKST
ncbi:MAG TPA: acyl-ACP desaturase [Planctomycetota bacterium]|nr:acyl-ACP desaturase [Planctomycetota bacterium]